MGGRRLVTDPAPDAGTARLWALFAGFCAWQYPLLAALFWRKEVAVIVVIMAGVVDLCVRGLLPAGRNAWRNQGRTAS